MSLVDDNIYFSNFPVNRVDLNITTTVFDALPSGSELETLKDMTEGKETLLVTSSRENDGNCFLHTQAGIFKCIFVEENNAFTVRYRLKDEQETYERKRAAREGRRFKLKEGLRVTVNLNDYNIHETIDSTSDPSNSSNPGGAQQIIKCMEVLTDSANSSIDAPDYLTKDLLELLIKARNYAELSNDLEKQNAYDSDSVYYTANESVEQSGQTGDMPSYRFYVRDFDKEKFPLGSYVQIPGIQEESYSANIVSYIQNGRGEVSAVDLQFKKQVGSNQISASGIFTLSFNAVNRNVQIHAIESIESRTAPSRYMDHILVDEPSPAGFIDLSASDQNRLQTALSTQNLNDSQKKAIIDGIRSKDAYLVMGPPGTGKTTVILEWVKYFTKQGKRVLVSSKNNKAVDNVLTRLHKEEGIEMLRIGTESKVDDDLRDCLYDAKMINLREKIRSSTSGTCTSITEVLKQWQNYQDELSVLEQEGETVRQKRGVAEDAVRKYLLSKEKALYDAMEKHRQLFSERTACRNRIQEHQAEITKRKKEIQVLEEYQFGQKNVRSFFKSIFPFKRTEEDYTVNIQKKTEEIIFREKDCRRMREREKDLYVKASMNAMHYKQLRREYQLLFALLQEDDGFYAEYNRADREYQAHFRTAKSKLQKLPGEAGLFQNLRNSQRSPAETDPAAWVKKIKTEIETETARAKAIQESLKEWEKITEDDQLYYLQDILLDSVNLVGATCIGISSQQRFSDLAFDVTIIDEAGQIQIHDALVPMSRSNKLIMLGDYMQIPPMVSQELSELCDENEVSTDLLETSLFEKMYASFPASNKVMLDTQYRMPDKIADTISEWFYEKNIGRYNSHPSKHDCRSLLPALFCEPFVIIDTSAAGNREESRPEGYGYKNHLEAETAASVVRAFTAAEFGTGILPGEIGAITGYKAQAALIRSMLEDMPDLAPYASDIAASLDSFQGQERDVIIYSFVRSNSRKKEESRRIGFLSELRRMNVAMTRCKKMLILIGDMEYLKNCRNGINDETGSEEVITRNEYHFGRFIQKLISDVREKGRGEYLPVTELQRRFSLMEANHEKA